MDKVRSPIPWIRGSFALFLALLVMAVAIPNTGKIIIDRTTSPPTTHIEGRFMQSAIIVVIALLPVVCISFLDRRWIAAEVLGWLMLCYLVIGMFLK
jgi:hypothetical protein